MRGDVRAQEFVADVRAVALEGLAAGHLVGGLVHGADDGGRQRLGHVADAEVDQADVGMGVGERLRPAPDLGEQIVLVEVQVRLVEAGHDVRTRGSRPAAASRPARS